MHAFNKSLTPCKICWHIHPCSVVGIPLTRWSNFPGSLLCPDRCPGEQQSSHTPAGVLFPQGQCHSPDYPGISKSLLCSMTKVKGSKLIISVIFISQNNYNHYHQPLYNQPFHNIIIDKCRIPFKSRINKYSIKQISNPFIIIQCGNTCLFYTFSTCCL